MNLPTTRKEVLALLEGEHRLTPTDLRVHIERRRMENDLTTKDDALEDQLCDLLDFLTRDGSTLQYRIHEAANVLLDATYVIDPALRVLKIAHHPNCGHSGCKPYFIGVTTHPQLQELFRHGWEFTERQVREFDQKRLDGTVDDCGVEIPPGLRNRTWKATVYQVEQDYLVIKPRHTGHEVAVLNVNCAPDLKFGEECWLDLTGGKAKVYRYE